MTVSSPPHLPEWPASSWRLPGTPLLITWTRGEGLLLWIQGRDPILRRFTLAEPSTHWEVP